MGCRRLAVLAATLLAVVDGMGHDRAWAHAGLRMSNPGAGATLGDTPKVVQLTFWERPEPALSVVRILDTDGVAYQLGPPESVPGAPLSLAVPVRRLGRGVYTVTWRTLSAVDGHATAGAFAFGVQVKPTGAGAFGSNAYPAASRFEMLSRFVLIGGLVAVLGAAAAGAGRFGATSDVGLGAGGWLVATIGLALLGEAQRENAVASYAVLMSTSIGRALLWRAVALAAAGGALLAARRPGIRRAAMAALLVASMAAVAAHVAAGHAGAGGRWAPATVGAQWAHFAAAGIWIGGLAALLLGVRGAPSADKATAVRRFSGIAALGLLVVVVTGIVRTVGELTSWRELIATGYGRAVLAKAVLLAGVAALGARNRWRSVPVAGHDLGALRRNGRRELALAALALGAAAMLGALPPPAAGLAAPVELTAAGSDFGTTVRARLTVASDQPGPNRFVVRLADYDSGKPVHARRVTLGFLPTDDPGVVATSLPLEPGPGDSYTGSGANLAFDGRWRVTVLVERARDSVEVPLDVEVQSVRRFLSVERIPGRPPKYTVQVTAGEFLRISPDPERAGPSQISVSSFDMFGDEQPIEGLVVTAAAGGGPARQLPVRRMEPNRYVADVELRPGPNTIAAIARTADGTRLRATVDLDVPTR